jgi:hypothetical protein
VTGLSELGLHPGIRQEEISKRHRDNGLRTRIQSPPYTSVVIMAIITPRVITGKEKAAIIKAK